MIVPVNVALEIEPHEHSEVHVYDWVTEEMFDAKLAELVGAMNAAALLAVPGVYECLREELNNDVLSALEAERAEQAEPEDE